MRPSHDRTRGATYIHARKRSTHLGRSDVRRDNELDAPVSKDPENEPEEIPLLSPREALEDLDRALDATLLVMLPRLALEAALPRSVDAGLPWRAPGKRKARADKDGLDVELLERAEVRLDERRQREREPTGGCDEGLAGERGGEQLAKVRRQVDPEPRVGESRERARRDEPALDEVGWLGRRISRDGSRERGMRVACGGDGQAGGMSAGPRTMQPWWKGAWPDPQNCESSPAGGSGGRRVLGGRRMDGG